MTTSRAAATLVLLLSAASIATPFAQQLPAQERIAGLPANPYCLRAACGYGRDGIPTPYSGGGLRGRSAQAQARALNPVFPAMGATLSS